MMHDSDEGAGAAQMEMPRYVSHKRVWALEIATVSPPPDIEPGAKATSFRLTFRDSGYAPMYAAAEMFSRYVPIPGDYYVVYADGYPSFSPRKAFLEGYTRETK